MAEVRPLQALHYNLSAIPSLADVTAPPYDVIDAEQRAELLARSPLNVVEIDLPQAPAGGDPYEHAAETLEAWTLQGVLTADREPAIWALTQDYRGPDGSPRTRRGFLARVRVTEYGPGLVRPHERTQPGPQGGPPAADPGHPPQPVADLRPSPRGRLAAHRAPPGRRPLGRGHRPRRHRASHLARRRPRRPRGARRGAGRRRASDRRRAPPLRDRPHLRRPDRRRGAASLHAHVPGLARGPRPDDLRHPPPAPRPRRRRPGAAGRGHPRALRARGGGRRTTSIPPAATASASSATSTPTSGAASACGSRTPRRSTRRSPTARRRTGDSTR